jgi:hypothetical protein
MPEAEKSNITKCAFLSTMAVAGTAVVAGAPLAAAALADPAAKAGGDPQSNAAVGWETRDPKAWIDRFFEMLLAVNISEIAESDEHVLYAIRVPREVALSNNDLLAVDRLADDTLGADLAAWLAARIQPI